MINRFRGKAHTLVDLNLGIIGNCSFGALIDRGGSISWCCLPRFDDDPVFCQLLKPEADDSQAIGFYRIDLENQVRSEQAYFKNTAVLSTKVYDREGGAIEIVDFAPRFASRGRIFRPTSIIRIVRPLSGAPRVRVLVRPVFDYGGSKPSITSGSNHIRYVGTGLTLRLTTNAPISYVLDETSFFLESPLTLHLGPDETLSSPIVETGREFFEKTCDYWREWVRQLALPLDWQDAVIRAAITLKLCSFEETGAIIAAMTTSIPEVADSGRNWDYRYCWLRDAFFVVRALNRVGAITTMENYLRYLANITASAEDGHLQPVYGIGQETRLPERQVDTLSGYRSMGPVRIGNQAYEHDQHDVYGHVVLAATQAFFDERLLRPAGITTYRRLESVGERAFTLHDQPDAGIWELRTRSRVHTSSSLMCWAACDRLAKVAAHLGLTGRVSYWQEKANHVRQVIWQRAWNDERNAVVESFEGDESDASLLLMNEIGFVERDDPRFISTVAAIERDLRRGNHLFRYAAADDFGVPQNAFNICTFWYVEALIALGRLEEARELFESMLACRNDLGLLSEDTDPRTNEPWGNYPQTYSLVGLIHCARRLSRSWEDVL